MATVGDVVSTVTATGLLQPVVNVLVGSQVSGLIKELRVDFNSPVKAAQMIARLDDAPFIAALHSAEGNLAAARSDLHAAQLNATRNQELFARNLVAQSDLDTAEAAVEKTQAQVVIAQANLERAQLDVSHCTVTSPVDGIVTSRNVDVGQTVAASLSAPTLFTIAADLTKSTSSVIAEHHDVVLVPNAALRIHLAAGSPAPGTAPRARTTSGANSSTGKSGLGAGPAVRDPTNSPRTLYTLVDTPAASPDSHRVRTGLSDGQRTEILDGINAGDRIIVAALGSTPSASARSISPLAGGGGMMR